jgi:uncharacterized protein YecT (DUF1311 family)
MKNAMRWMKRCSLVAVLLLAASHGARAWAMDCTAATSTLDKVVCADMARDDAKLNDEYNLAMQRLSPESQSALRADQQMWLRYKAIACGSADGGIQGGAINCLFQMYRRRGQLMSQIAYQRRPGPGLFTYTLRSSYETTPDPAGGLPFWSESSIPQIDPNMLSPNLAWSDVQVWNDMVAKLIGGLAKSSVCPGGKGEIYRLPYVHLVSIMLFTVSVDRDDSCRGLRPNLVIVRGEGPLGMPPQDHFMSQTQYNIVMMRGDVHLLQPSDLFVPGDGWKRLLTDRVEQEAQKQARDHRENWHPSREAIERVATDPSNWLPGLDFSIRVSQPALGADEMIGGFTVNIPAEDLQHVLSFKGKRILSAPNF